MDAVRGAGRAHIVAPAAQFAQHRLQGAKSQRRRQAGATKRGATGDPLDRRLHLESVAQLAHELRLRADACQSLDHAEDDKHDQKDGRFFSQWIHLATWILALVALSETLVGAALVALKYYQHNGRHFALVRLSDCLEIC